MGHTGSSVIDFGHFRTLRIVTLIFTLIAITTASEVTVNLLHVQDKTHTPSFRD